MFSYAIARRAHTEPFERGKDRLAFCLAAIVIRQTQALTAKRLLEQAIVLPEVIGHVGKILVGSQPGLHTVTRGCRNNT